MLRRILLLSGIGIPVPCLLISFSEKYIEWYRSDHVQLRKNVISFDSKIPHGLKGYIAVKRDDGEVKGYLNSLIYKDESEDEPF